MGAHSHPKVKEVPSYGKITKIIILINKKGLEIMKTFIVIGGKWFDKINGNTYHNSKIIDAETGKTYYTGYAYGYGSQYKQSAKEFIQDQLKLKETEYKLIDGGSFYGLKKQELKMGAF